MKHNFIGIIILILSHTTMAQSNNCAGLITDKPYYLLGDTIRGQAFILKPCEQQNHPLEVALLAPDGQAAVRQLIDFGEDTQFIFPLTGLSQEGMYQLLLSYPKASDELLLQQELAIINPAAQEASATSEASSLQVYHYGPLVKGLAQDMVISIVNAQGEGQSLSGEINNAAGVKVTDFTTDEAGLVTFNLIPDSAQRYHIRTADGRLKFDLPQTQDAGISVELLPDNKELTIIINGHYRGQELVVKLTENDGTIREKSIFPNQSKSVLRFDRQKHNTGFGLLQVFGPENQKLWHQLFYQGSKPLNDKMILDKTSVAGEITQMSLLDRRDQQNYFCSIIDGNQIPLIAYSPFQNPQWLIAQMAQQNAFFNQLLMLWGQDSTLLQKIFDNKPLARRLEYGGALLGRLVNQEAIPQRFVPIILSVPSEESSLQYSVSSARGIFSFKGFLFEGTKTGYLYPMLVDPQQLKDLRIEVIDPTTEASTTNTTFTQLKKKLSPWIRIQALNRRITEIYATPSDTLEQEAILLNNHIISNYGEADHYIDLTQLVTFSSMRQVIKEAMANVNLVQKSIRVFSKEERKNFAGKPLMLVDGMPTLSDSVIFNLDPANLVRIEIVNSRRKLMSIGALGQNGLIAFYTKNGKDVEDMTGVQKVSLTGYDVIPSHSKINISNSSPRTPNLQDVIYWNPKLNSDGKISFQLPNNLTFYNILLGSYGLEGFSISAETIKAE